MVYVMARPSKYDDINLILVEGWARNGLTDEQIAHNIGINVSTLYEWKKKYSEFSDTLKRGKEIVDRMVENALFKRAMGYTFEEITYEDGLEVKRVRKEVVPDTTAQIFWLKNRKPAEWRDKQQMEHSGDLVFTVKKPDDMEDD